MKFEEYEREQFFKYEEFAQVVGMILSNAIDASGLPKPQSIRHRAKSPKSLKERLEEADKLDSPHIEEHRRDLAGVRIIFYTNSDVEKFLNARLIFENFDVEKGTVRIHHPTKENQERRYRGIHYTINLKNNRTKLAEYSRYAGMRCEIQVQTILNHAWSETSHDIAYKNKLPKGFGRDAMEAIRNRLNRIMDQYLMPAGYEFQRVQHDYERLLQGKKLFDRDLLTAITVASDNNLRHEILISLRDEVIPNYDDVSAIYDDLMASLVSAVKGAKESKPKPIETPFGQLEGKTAADVTSAAVDIIDALRYIDVSKTFDVLCKLFDHAPSEEASQRIIKAAERLAGYDQPVWEKVGPAVQVLLVDAAARVRADQNPTTAPLLIATYRALLSLEIEGTIWRADSVTLTRASMPVLPDVLVIRGKAIASLFDLFTKATSDEEKRTILSALRGSTRLPHEHSNQLLRQCILDAIRIVEFLATHASSLSYEIREWMEEGYLFDYHRARQIADDIQDKFGCASDARQLMASIIQLRDCINQDQLYVRYKTLVGFRTVLPEHWSDEDWPYDEVEKFRLNEAQRFVDEINTGNESEWLGFIERCATTQSNDAATFPIFSQFLTMLAKQKPEIAHNYLTRATDDLLRFLPAFLSGLFESKAKELYLNCLDYYLHEGTHLPSLIRHYRISKPGRPEFITAVLKRAIATADEATVTHCLLFALEGTSGDGVPSSNEFFVPAISFLTGLKSTHWVRQAWMAHKETPFFNKIDIAEARLLLANLIEAPAIDYRAEEILCRIAEKWLPMVWGFFSERIAHPAERTIDGRYDAIPYQFHKLHKELAKEPALAIETTRTMYAVDSEAFRFRGGRLFHITYPEFSAEISRRLCELITNGSKADAEYAIGIMMNYHGEAAIHDVLKCIVAKYPNDEEVLAGVRISIDSTGTTVGEYGRVEAMRQKKAAIASWLSDPNPDIRAFAERHTLDLGTEIADEQRRAEQRQALRRLEYDKDDDGNED
ncbi:hypothetical protein FRZ61_07230 [Hypericibacter adhaerens]|jgi:ppGpp synthetase/RelA/SpoT-type nucleotidyltranferase|uniref:RelA/SpoT domain-containing protein n=1 Tax=Hypericibacter adhaerens TaxID=2602016 RepID=A0A5J6MUG8_9PROT|nr:RelA/SpoT domain-containing protein [Hypericibacter adhaerens]QEX20804.1 hypothetical protein FRZ61_07230 [Hypericibacter adhaerens]